MGPILDIEDQIPLKKKFNLWLLLLVVFAGLISGYIGVGLFGIRLL